MPFDLGAALNTALDKGFDVWVDSEKAKNYTPGVQTVGQRDGQGGTMQAGQSSMVLPSWANNPAVKWGAVAVVVLVAVFVIRKL